MFAPQWSDTAVSSISLSGRMRRQRSQVVLSNLLAGQRDCHDESRFRLSSMNKYMIMSPSEADEYGIPSFLLEVMIYI